MSKVLLTALVGVAALAAAPARAQLQFTLTPASQTYAAGTSATWTGSFLNTGATTLTFSFDTAFSGLPSGLTVDDTLYFTNLAGTTLDAGASVMASIFTTTASTSLVPATYNSSVSVGYTGGAPSPSDATAAFTSVIVAVGVPEPSSALLSLLALPGLVLVRRRRA